MLGWVLASTAWPRELPDLRPHLATGLALAGVPTIATFTRARRLAVGAAVIVPLLVSSAWHLLESSWAREWKMPAASGDPAAIGMVLRGAEKGWLWAIGPATVAGTFSALLVAFYFMWALERADPT